MRATSGMDRVIVCLLGLAALMTLAGCGGGSGSDGTATGATTRVNADIQWGARSRAIAGPGSALSVVLTLSKASPDGTDFIWTVNRDAPLAAHTTGYSSPNVAKVGTWNLTVRFYDQPDGRGDVVAFATPTVTINTDGSGIGTVQTTGTVASVIVEANQVLTVGQTTDLAFSARDAKGALLVLTPGSAFFELVGPSDVLQFSNQQAVALKPGTATVRVTADGVTSANQIVTVAAPVSVSIDPASAALVVNGAQTFSATVANSANQSVSWSVQEGAAGGTITPAGVYTAPATAGTFHIVATSVADPSKSATATVTVQANSAGVSVSISPSNAVLAVGGQQTFTVTVTGVSSHSVIWSVKEGVTGGTLTADGVYTASTIPGTYHVIAASVADPNSSATATVTVQ